MAIRIKHWDNSQAKREISKRYSQSTQSRKRLEDQWSRNEYSVYGPDAVTGSSLLLDGGGNAIGGYEDGGDDSVSRVNVAYSFKNLRFIHSQLSANPPSVAMRPTSSDQGDTRKADAADRVVRFAIRKYQMQENVDQLTLNALVYGTSCIKTIWDSTRGDIIGFDQETGEIDLEGDISITIPHTRNIFLDPDARALPQLKWVIERIYMDMEEALVRWPDKEEELKRAKTESGQSGFSVGSNKEEHFNSVELLEYWETGLPTNGYLGRYCVTTADGSVIEPCRPSPFRFPKSGSIAAIMESDKPDEVKERLIAKLPQMASLPYHFLTDIDVSNTIWGKSFLEYTAPLQEVLTQIDTAYLDNIRAHGVARMIVPSNAEVDIDLSNSPWDVTKVDSNMPPYFMEVPQLMPEMTASRGNMIQGINDVSGVNEAMFGQQSREQSGASMQYATNQGNMIRRRLFNKYVLCVESIYKAMLNLVRKHWTIERTIRVLGEEKAFEAISLKGADIDGGYDVVGEYGVSLSLDPMARREEIMALQPLFEKAGIPTRMSLKMMKLNELEGMYDKLQMAEDRQSEIFNEMIASQILIQPEEYQDHENMIAWAMDYFMSAEFKYLDEESRVLCKEHIRMRIQRAAEEKSGGVSAQPQAPGPAPSPDQTQMLEAAPAPEMPAIVNG